MTVLFCNNEGNILMQVYVDHLVLQRGVLKGRKCNEGKSHFLISFLNLVRKIR
jgi:hypothetical protein